MIGRRAFVATTLAAAAGLAMPGRAAPPAATIRMISLPDGSDVWFEPVGLWVAPGTVVTWTNGADQANSHTATAYHPANGHSLRIPAGAKPWDSGYLLPGARFSVTLTEEGVYDYFCLPHEAAGMVGRIVVGQPGGAGAIPFDRTVPIAAQRAFPAVEEILRRGSVSRPSLHPEVGQGFTQTAPGAIDR
jgi:plastocyanin